MKKIAIITLIVSVTIALTTINESNASNVFQQGIKLLTEKSIPKKALWENMDPYSILYYALLNPAILNFLYRQGLVSENDLDMLLGWSKEKNILNTQRIKNWLRISDPEHKIEKALTTLPYIKALRKYYRDSVITQAGLGGTAIAALGGLHYYNKWPVYAMQDLEKKYNSTKHLEIKLSTLKNIKNSITFWNNVLHAMEISVPLDQTWLELDKILSIQKNLIGLLLYTAVKRLETMHGIWKYGPTGWYRKAQEVTGDFSDASSRLYRKTLQLGSDTLKSSKDTIQRIYNVPRSIRSWWQKDPQKQ